MREKKTGVQQGKMELEIKGPGRRCKPPTFIASKKKGASDGGGPPAYFPGVRGKLLCHIAKGRVGGKGEKVLRKGKKRRETSK